MSNGSPAHDERAGFFDLAAYWLTLLGVYFLVGVLFFYSGKDKLFVDDGHAPAALKMQPAGTFIDTFPGVDAAWVIIGILELAIFALILFSILRGEFFSHRRKSSLLVALALSLLNYACLSFGQTSTGNNQGTASLYTYFGATAVIFLLVLRLPPKRARPLAQRTGAAVRLVVLSGGLCRTGSNAGRAVYRRRASHAFGSAFRDNSRR
jgi:hypothetical protein